MALNPYQRPQDPRPHYLPPTPYRLHLVAPVAGNNGLAVASLVLGVAGLVTIIPFFGVPSILALIFGVVGRRQIAASAGSQHGRGMALAGTILGIVGIAVVCTLVVLAILALMPTGRHAPSGL